MDKKFHIIRYVENVIRISLENTATTRKYFLPLGVACYTPLACVDSFLIHCAFPLSSGKNKIIIFASWGMLHVFMKLIYGFNCDRYLVPS